jgi:release factor glutamine methyltransferase
MTIDAANRLLHASISEYYDERESASISSLIMERLTGMPKNIRVLHKSESFTQSQEELFHIYLADLLRQRPVQYVLGEAWFGNLPFYVDERVLIPRPETEELANWLLKDEGSAGGGLSVLDIGTGSGCIAVYLKKKRSDLHLMAIDISGPALEVAQKNSRVHDSEMEFILCDIRDGRQTDKIPASDLIISNPPYIPEKEKALLDIHVRDFEPAIALFAPDEDPILYYKIIGKLALKKLNPEGAVFLEIHHDYAREIQDWYNGQGFLVELKTDFSGNNRMIKASRP